MSTLTDQILSGVSNLATLNDSVAPDIETLKAAHASMVAKGEALVQKIRNSTTPVPAPVAAAANTLASAQNALASYAGHIEGISLAFNQVMASVQAVLEPGAGGAVSASPPGIPGAPK
jgi:hypothetical protein